MKFKHYVITHGFDDLKETYNNLKQQHGLTIRMTKRRPYYNIGLEVTTQPIEDNTAIITSFEDFLEFVATEGYRLKTSADIYYDMSAIYSVLFFDDGRTYHLVTRCSYQELGHSEERKDFIKYIKNRNEHEILLKVAETFESGVIEVN